MSTSPADGASANNTSTASTTATAGSGLPANVYVKISPSSATVALNGAVSLAVEQGNYGPNAAAGIQTTVLLPPGLPTSGATAPTLAGYTLSASTATTATYTSGANTATYNTTTGVFTLPAAGTQASGTTGGAANSYTLGYTATTAGVFPATATVSTTTPDPVLGDNVASAEVTVNPGVADLGVALTGPTVVSATAPLTYTMTTTNFGPADAQSVLQRVSILAGLGITGPNAVRINGALPTSVSAGVATYGSGPTAVTYSSITGIVTFPAAALPVLAVGSAVSNTITYLAPANGNTTLANTASVQSGSPDANLANNSASVAAPLQPVADVQVTISSSGFITTNASGGNPILFGVNTLNNGPSSAPTATTTVNLPASLPITGSGPEVVRMNGQLPSSVSAGVATYNFPDGSSATYDSNSSSSSATPGRVTFSVRTNLTPGGPGISATIGFVLPTGYIGQLVATAKVVVGGVFSTPTRATTLPWPSPFWPLPWAQTTCRRPSRPRPPRSRPASRSRSPSPRTPARVPPACCNTCSLPPGLTSNGGTVLVSGGPGGSVVTGGTLSPNYDNNSGLLTFPSILTLNAATSYSVVISNVPGSGPLVASASITANELDAAPANNVAVASVAITPSFGPEHDGNRPGHGRRRHGGELPAGGREQRPHQRHRRVANRNAASRHHGLLAQRRPAHPRVGSRPHHHCPAHPDHAHHRRGQLREQHRQLRGAGRGGLGRLVVFREQQPGRHRPGRHRHRERQPAHGHQQPAADCLQRGEQPDFARGQHRPGGPGALGAASPAPGPGRARCHHALHHPVAAAGQPGRAFAGRLARDGRPDADGHAGRTAEVSARRRLRGQCRVHLPGPRQRRPALERGPLPDSGGRRQRRPCTPTRP